MDSDTLLAALQKVRGLAKGFKAQQLKKKYLTPQDAAEGSPDEEASESPDVEAAELGAGEGDAPEGLDAASDGPDAMTPDAQAKAGPKLSPEDIQKLMALLGKK